MNHPLFWLSVASAVIDWYAVWKTNRHLEYVAKPAMMVFLIAWVITMNPWNSGMLWFLLGLIFSLGGDVFLMLPNDKFIAGLISFLFAHVFYIIGLNLPPYVFNLAHVALVLFVVLPAIQIYRRLATSLDLIGKSSLKMPVLAYTVVISAMLISALFTLTKPEWLPTSSLSVSFGALFFFLSDAILAWNRFVQPIRFGRLMNMATYHVGQILICIGSIIHFLS